MAASEARIRANRLNAQKSTGPKTEEGKAASRANAYKHGLTGSGVVGPEEDRAAVDRLATTLHEEMRPATALGSILVGRMAALAVRMDRCGRWESASIAERVRNAEGDFDERRAAEVDDAFGRLVDLDDPSDPSTLLRVLRRTPEGVTRLIQAWVDLASAVRRPDLSPWTDAHLRTLHALTGRRPTDLYPSRVSLLARVLDGGDLSGLPGTEAAPLARLDPQGRASWARDRLFELITAEVEGLEAAYHELDIASIGLDRAEAPTRALFDPSNGANLARKYEAAAERGFFRALAEFERAEAAVEVAPESRGSAGSPADGPTGSLASFFRGGVAPPSREVPAPPSPRSGDLGCPEGHPESAVDVKADGGSAETR